MATPAPQSAAPRTAPPGGLDPDVKIPKAVRDAAKRADDLIKAQNGNEPPATADAPPSQGNDLIVISDAPIDPPAAPPPAPQAQPPATPPAPQPAVPAEPTGDTVSRADYLAMKGRFEKANANNVRMAEEVNNLRTLVTQLSTAQQAAPSPANLPPEQRAASLLSEQEIADYGPDFLEVVGKKAQEVAGVKIAELEAKIEALTKGVQTTAQMSAQSAREQLISKMDSELPEWRTQNSQPEFLDWLRLPDLYSGAIRADLLKQAFDQNNAARVLAFFKGFLSEEAATTPAMPTPLPAITPNEKVPLENFAAPGRAKSAAATPPAEKPIITRAQVTQFYLDVAAGKYRGREEEKNRLEAMIFSATNEGRLR